MFVLAPRLPCALLLAALLWVPPAAPGSLTCDPQALPGMVIDIGLAVAKGARFTDPINAASAEECASACCSELGHTGDRACNLAVYDTRKGTTLQNCYLFLCPGPEACPMSPARGVLSYSIWTENSSPERSDGNPAEERSSKTPKSKENRKTLSSSGKKPSSAVHPVVPVAPVLEEEFGQQDSDGKKPAPDIDLQSKSSPVKHSGKDADDTTGHITSELLHLAENIDRRLEKMEAEPQEEEHFDGSLEDLPIIPADAETAEAPVTSSRHKGPKKPPPKELEEDTKKTRISKVIEKKPETLQVHFPKPESTMTMTTTTLRTSQKITTAAPRPALHTKPSLVMSSSTSKGSKVANKVPSSDMKSIKVLSSQRIDISPTTVKSLQGGHFTTTTTTTTTEVPATSTTQNTKSAQPKTPDNFPQTSKGVKSTLKDEARSFTGKDKKELDSPGVPPADLNSPKNLDAQEPVSGNSDKSGLVAALVFGVVFLLVIVGLVSRKVSEARRRHRYTKLDYLINGMYVDT